MPLSGQANRDHVRKWRKANPEKRREQARKEATRKRASRTPADKLAVRQANWKYYLKKVFGLTLEQYDALVAEQQGRCAVCGVVPTKLEVDHDHVTGRVRGLLCGLCNRGLGNFRDSPEALEAGAAYLRRQTVGEEEAA